MKKPFYLLAVLTTLLWTTGCTDESKTVTSDNYAEFVTTLESSNVFESVYLKDGNQESENLVIQKNLETAIYLQDLIDKSDNDEQEKIGQYLTENYLRTNTSEITTRSGGYSRQELLEIAQETCKMLKYSSGSVRRIGSWIGTTVIEDGTVGRVAKFNYRSHLACVEEIVFRIRFGSRSDVSALLEMDNNLLTQIYDRAGLFSQTKSGCRKTYFNAPSNFVTAVGGGIECEL